MTPWTVITTVVQALANEAGVILLLIIVGIAGWRRVWVWGAELKRADSQLKDEYVRHMAELTMMRIEKDQWRAAALWSLGHPSFRDTPRPDIPEED